MRALRCHVLPGSTASYRLLFGFAAVVAIVFGLLAMHSLNTSPEHSVGGAATVVEASALDVVLSSGSRDLTNDLGCSGTCGSEHAMAVMGCVLALIATGLLLLAPLLRIGLGRTTGTLLPFHVYLRSLPVPQGPSLHVLSISRT